MLRSLYRSKIYLNFSAFSTVFRTIRRNIQGRKFEDGVYFLDRFISPGDICVDIGAAYGRYTLPISRLIGKSGHVYGFEPTNYSYKILVKIVKFHRLKNVTTIKKGLSDREGVAELAYPIKKSGKASPGMAFLTPTGLGNSNCLLEEVELTTLDKYCSAMNINRVDFIKCDVEGSELLVMNGAYNTISKYKPTVLCEIDEVNLKRVNHTPEQIHDFFKQLGYRSFYLKADVFKEVDNVNAYSNYVFMHADNEKINKLI